MDLTKATPELFAAIAAAQKEIQNPRKDSKNDYFQSSYASLPEVLERVREVYPPLGLSIIQDTAYDSGMVNVTTIVAHSGGGYISSTASALAKGDAQSIGSATSYLRRYALAAMAGIAQDDDDGSVASEGVRAAKMPYPPESMERNLPTWRQNIADGKVRPRDIIAMIASRYELSEAQIKVIEGLADE